MRLFNPRRSSGNTSVKASGFSGRGIKMTSVKGVSVKPIKIAKGKSGRIKL